MKEVSFDRTPVEADLINQIAQRGMGLPWGSKPDLMALEMDITAAHCNGNPLRLAALLAAKDLDFAHDVGGIVRHIDRSTGKLGGHFVPRYSAPHDSIDPGAEIEKAIFG